MIRENRKLAGLPKSSWIMEVKDVVDWLDEIIRKAFSFLKDDHATPTLLPISGFALNEKFQQNASKFAIDQGIH